MPTDSESFAAAADYRRSAMRLRRPEDLVAILPYVIGFTPVDSLVVVSLRGERRRFGPCLRVDLAVDDAEAEFQAGYLVDLMVGHRFPTVVLVAFSRDGDRAAAVVRPLLRQAGERRIAVAEALRADGTRWWSYLCHDPACCPPDGTGYDADTSEVAAEAVLAGMRRAPDRDWLRGQFRSADPEAVASVAVACLRLRGARGAGCSAGVGAADVRKLVVGALAEPDALPVADIAALLLAVQDDAVRDVAWRLMTRTTAAGHFRLWRHLMRTAPNGLMAPAGTLAAFAAWLDGRGVDASHALDRVEGSRPCYPMCGLVRTLVDGMVDPAVWSSVRLGSSPGR